MHESDLKHIVAVSEIDEHEAVEQLNHLYSKLDSIFNEMRGTKLNFAASYLRTDMDELQADIDGLKNQNK